LCVVEIKGFEKSNLIIKLKIHAEIDKKLVFTRKRAEKKIIKLVKRFHDVLSFDLLKSVILVFKKSLTRIDKLRSQVV
jgi:hypothetical protein